MTLDDRSFGDIELADAESLCLQSWREGWEIPAPLSVSQYADDKRKLPTAAASEPGRWRTARTPYLREIMDCLSDSSPVREISLRKSTQVGGTEVAINFIDYTIDHDPAAMLVVLPTIKSAQDWVEQRFTPMIEIMPSLKKKLGNRRSRDSGNRTLSKRFPGGHLFIAGANSSSDLASKPIKKLVLDEVDKYPRDLDKQGSAKTQAIRRTSTNPERKIFVLSSPTVKGASEIDDEFERGDQRYYNVPCPHCLHLQVLEDAQITRDGMYACIGCGKLIDERHKEWMLVERSEENPHGARWVPTRTDVDPRIRSYDIWAAYAPSGLGYTWKEIADMRAEAAKDPDKMIEYVNTILGKSHDSSTMRIKANEVSTRAGTWATRTVPQGALVITIGVDVQINRFDVSVIGWGRGERAWVLDWISLPADPTVLGDYDQLDTLMTAPLINRHGVPMRPAMMAIDSGKWTHEVYAYARRSTQKVIPTKGLESKERPIILRSTPVDVRVNGRIIPHGVKLWPIGTRKAKDTLIGRLVSDEQRPSEARYFSFPADLPDEYFQQLCAEKFNDKLDRWICPKGHRNEALDCLVLAYAAALHPTVHIHKNRDPEWAALEAHYEPIAQDLFVSRAQPTGATKAAPRTAPAASPQAPATNVPHGTQKQIPTNRDSDASPFGSKEWGSRL